jgi:hypothetical protein
LFCGTDYATVRWNKAAVRALGEETHAPASLDRTVVPARRDICKQAAAKLSSRSHRAPRTSALSPDSASNRRGQIYRGLIADLDPTNVDEGVQMELVNAVCF